MPGEVAMRLDLTRGLVLACSSLFLSTGDARISAQEPAKTQPNPPEMSTQRSGPNEVAQATVPSILAEKTQPIDLASALRLAGVQNPEILLAQERVLEAVAL